MYLCVSPPATHRRAPAHLRQVAVWLCVALVCGAVHAQTVAPPQLPQPSDSSQPNQPSEPALVCPERFASVPTAAANPTAANSAAISAAWAQQAQVLQSLAPACDKRADFHAQLGSLLLLLGRTEAAAQSLEKALLINPELPGALLDYAQALAELGQASGARQLASLVSERPDIDPALRQWLLSGPTLYANANGGTNSVATVPAPGTGWHWAQLWQSTAGHESNLASATHTTSVTLYLSNGPVVVPLDDSAQPQSGAALKNLLALQGQAWVGGGLTRVGLNLQSRHPQARRDASGVGSSLLGEVSASHARALGPGSAQLHWEGSQYRLQNTLAYQGQSLRLQYETQRLPLGPAWCQWGISAGTLEQRYPNSSNLNGRTTQGQLQGTCQHPDRSLTQWSLGTGHDKALSPLRPGGDKTRTDWSLRHQRTLGSASTQAWVKQTHTRDHQAFSPLLGSLVSRTTRLDWGLGSWWALGERWQVGLDLESTSQKSSNSLLNIKNMSLYAGLRWTHP